MKKKNILVDLKPALDGYAGIPQESRLLFSGLKHLDEGFSVDGLLQHGSGFLNSSHIDKTSPLNDKIIKDSKTVVSFCRNGVKTYIPGLPKSSQRYLALQELRWRSLRNQSVKMGVFQTDLFDDFIWRHLFGKTLPITDKKLVTASRFRIISHSRKQFHQVGLSSFNRHIKPRYMQLETGDYDFLLAQTPFPARVSKRTKLVIRYHDAFPVLMPHTISDVSFHQASHYMALKQNVKDGALFACVSEATRADLVKMFPEVERRSVTIPNLVSNDYHPRNSPKSRVRNIITNRASDNEGYLPDGNDISFGNDEDSDDYLLMVSTLEPRKNHQLLISAWERLRSSDMPNLKLILVGGQGWNFEPILDLIRPWMRRKQLYHLTNVATEELAVLYSHAAATICPSLAEGFDYSGIEAMRSGGLVISSDIPVHREIYGDGSAYFTPYSVTEAVDTISRVLAPDAQKERTAILQMATGISERYTAKNITPQWLNFFSNPASINK